MNLDRAQNLALCHVRRIVVTKEDLPKCKPLNLRNLYNLSSKNCLEPTQKARTACVRAVFLHLWKSPLIPLKKTPIFLTPLIILPKMLAPLKIFPRPLIIAPRNLFCLLGVGGEDS